MKVRTLVLLGEPLSCLFHLAGRAMRKKSYCERGDGLEPCSCATWSRLDPGAAELEGHRPSDQHTDTLFLTVPITRFERFVDGDRMILGSDVLSVYDVQLCSVASQQAPDSRESTCCGVLHWVATLQTTAGRRRLGRW